MARSRNIKPGFFENEELAALPALTRLLFAGLWTIADREGRLEDRPKKIKVQLLPYDDCDADEMLDQLAGSEGRFIVRYLVDGQGYIQIMQFKKHQKPHRNEAPSIIPLFTDQSQTKVRLNTDQGHTKDILRTYLIPTKDINFLPSYQNKEENQMVDEDKCNPESPYSTRVADESRTKDIPKTYQGPSQDSTTRADSLNPLTDSLNPHPSYSTREKNRVDAGDESFSEEHEEKNLKSAELGELIEKYRRIPGIGEDPRDPAFFEALTDKYTCQDIRIAISELQITMVLQEVRKPLPYLKSILEGKNKPSPAARAEPKEEEDEPDLSHYYKRVADDDPDWLETKARLEAAEKELQKRDDTG